MARIAPSVAAVRNAVRAALGSLPASSAVLVACSGGADSLALAAALGWDNPAPLKALAAEAVLQPLV